jgi:hypothetical protein
VEQVWVRLNYVFNSLVLGLVLHVMVLLVWSRLGLVWRSGLVLLLGLGSPVCLVRLVLLVVVCSLPTCSRGEMITGTL